MVPLLLTDVSTEYHMSPSSAIFLMLFLNLFDPSMIPFGQHFLNHCLYNSYRKSYGFSEKKNGVKINSINSISFYLLSISAKLPYFPAFAKIYGLSYLGMPSFSIFYSLSFLLLLLFPEKWLYFGVWGGVVFGNDLLLFILSHSIFLSISLCIFREIALFSGFPGLFYGCLWLR